MDDPGNSPAGDDRLSHVMARNAIFSVARYFLSVPLFLLLLPALLNALGSDRFGLWALAFIGTTAAVQFDLGMGPSLTKWVSEHRSRGDTEALKNVLAAGFVVVLVVGLAVFQLVSAAAPFLAAHVFHIPPQMQGEAQRSFIWGSAIFAAALIQIHQYALLQGFHRIDIASSIQWTQTLVIVVTMLVFVARGVTTVLPFLMIPFVVVCINIVITALIIPRVTGVRWPVLQKPQREAMKQLFDLGLWIQLSSWGQFIFLNVDKVYLGMLVGMTAVGTYEIGSKAAFYLVAIPQQLLLPMLPAASQLSADQSHETLRELYLRTLRLLTAVAVPLFIFILIGGEGLIRLWLGPGQDRSIVTLQVLTGGYLLNLATGPGFHILNGMGRPKPAVTGAGILIVLNIILSLLLINVFGYAGALMGTGIALAASSIWFLHKTQQLLEIPGNIYGPLLPLPIGLSLICAIPLAFTGIYPPAWVPTIAATLIYWCGYGFGLLQSTYLYKKDRHLIRRFLPTPLKIFIR